MRKSGRGRGKGRRRRRRGRRERRRGGRGRKKDDRRKRSGRGRRRGRRGGRRRVNRRPLRTRRDLEYMVAGTPTPSSMSFSPLRLRRILRFEQGPQVLKPDRRARPPPLAAGIVVGFLAAGGGGSGSGGGILKRSAFLPRENIFQNFRRRRGRRRSRRWMAAVTFGFLEWSVALAVPRRRGIAARFAYPAP